MTTAATSDHPSKVALFITSSMRFSEEWLENLCKTAERSAECSYGRNTPVRLEQIHGDFQGWTPFRLARDYVLPNFDRVDSPFAKVSFVVLDDESHNDSQVLIVGIHPDSFKGSQLEIEGTMRIEGEFAVNVPVVFDEGHQGILAYDPEPYDNDAER